MVDVTVIKDFIGKTEIAKEKIDKIKDYIENFCNTIPDDINYGHVGSLEYVIKHLEEIEEFLNL